MKRAESLGKSEASYTDVWKSRILDLHKIMYSTWHLHIPIKFDILSRYSHSL